MSGQEDKKFLSKIRIRYSPTFFGVKMPILPILFQNSPQPFQALVDSGATNSLLHLKIASILKLKIDYSKKRIGTGAGGSYNFVTTGPVEIDILKQKFFVKFDVPLDENFGWACILGQNSIFKFAKIEFKAYKEEFDIFFRVDIN